MIQEQSLRNRNIEDAHVGDFTCEASNNGMSARCVSTQYNIKYPNADDVLDAYNVLVDVTPLVVSIFGNCPFAGGVDTGFDDGRVEVLRQTKGSLRCILPRHASDLFEHYSMTFPEESAFVCNDPVGAFYQTYSGVHTSQRIKIDESKGHIRLEYRICDSMNPFEVMQGALYLMGIVESLKGKQRQSWPDVHDNFNVSARGMNGELRWDGRTYSADELCRESLNWVASGLNNLGLEEFDEFLRPLICRVDRGVSNAGRLRAQYTLQGDIINPVLEYLHNGMRGNCYVGT